MIGAPDSSEIAKFAVDAYSEAGILPGSEEYTGEFNSYDESDPKIVELHSKLLALDERLYF